MPPRLHYIPVSQLPQAYSYISFPNLQHFSSMYHFNSLLFSTFGTSVHTSTSIYITVYMRAVTNLPSLQSMSTLPMELYTVKSNQ